MQDDVSRLVGIEGLAVTGVVERAEQLEIEVELKLEAGCCRWCGRGSLKVKDRPVVRIRDLPVAGRVTWLLWRKRRFYCEACGRTFTETHPALPSRQRVSARFRAHLFERCRGGGAHLEIARDERTSCYQVNRAFAIGGDELLARRESAPPRRLSLDEAHHRRSHELATVVSDLDRRRVIEVLDGRSRRIVERYLRSLPEEHRRAIRVVSIDPYDAYRHAIQNELPWARIVVDHFHLVRGVNTALDSVRRERQREQARRTPKGTRRSGQRNRWNPALHQARHRLLKASERLNERERRQLCALFERDPVLAEAWGLKETFRAIYRASSRPEAQQRLQRFLAAVDAARLPAFDAFAKGLAQWQTELLAYFDEPTTNDYAEGVISKVKVIKRRAYGLPTFAGFRKRVVIACG
ncbi:MAG: ISL3 family transposase [Solirubrobacterales bacterium]|nr:ISL3 family transposase [Solirubrobacterales bacterium]